MHRDTALKVASGFCGGMGRMAETCGAVTGAFMVIGLKYGGTEVSDKDAKQKTTATVREFAKRFKARHGTIVCRKLLGCDISTDRGLQRAKDNGLLKRCPKLVGDAAKMLEDVLRDGKKRGRKHCQDKNSSGK